MSHAKIAELLPWYVNGTLGMGERQAAALEVASCDACAREVDELTKIQNAMLELQATAPEPGSGGLARALDAVDDFEERKRLGHPWFGWWWSLAPLRRALVVSTALGALVVIGIFVAPKEPLGTGTLATPDESTPIALERATSDVIAGAKAPLGSAAAQPGAAGKTHGAPTQSLAGAPIARTAGMSLVVPDVETAIARVGAAADAQGGEVLSLDDETPAQPGLRHTAHVEIGVPDMRFEPTLAALGRLGGVQSRTVAAEDVATQIVDAQARLSELRSTEGDLLRIMSRTGKIADVLAVEQQVAATREQIEQLEGDVQSLKTRVAMSTVAVDLVDEAQADPAAIDVGTQLRDSWSAAVSSVRGFTVAIVATLLWVVAYGPYVLGVALAGGLIAANRRRY